MFLVLLTQKHVNELKLSTDLKGWQVLSLSVCEARPSFSGFDGSSFYQCSLSEGTHNTRHSQFCLLFEGALMRALTLRLLSGSGSTCLFVAMQPGLRCQRRPAYYMPQPDCHPIAFLPAFHVFWGTLLL